MIDETVYFDEDVKGDRTLVTSRVIAFEGIRFDTTAVDGVSAAAYRHSINAIPADSSFRVSVSCGDKSISIDCAGWFWFGGKRYERFVPRCGRRLAAD